VGLANVWQELRASARDARPVRRQEARRGTQA
jgi:hypothetical protein